MLHKNPKREAVLESSRSRQSFGRWLAWVPLLAAAQLLTGCGGSSGGGSTSGSGGGVVQATKISGVVDDAFVLNATVTAYTVSAAGVIGACVPAASGSGCATATTNSNGIYSINLGSYGGPVILESVGGSYTDTVTGQTVSIPSSLVLSVFLPSVSPGTTTITAQITGLTTIAAQMALQQMAQGTAAAAAATAANTNVQNNFGGLANIISTALVDPTQSNCGTAAANQSSFDASLILAGVSQLASQYGVSSIQLTLALAEDLSDGQLDGMLDSATPITVPLASGNGSVPLATIEGSSFTASLEAAIVTFQSSAADACKATQSSSQASALPEPYTPPPPFYSYTLNAEVNGYAGSADLQLKYFVELSCPADVLVGGATVATHPYISNSGPFTTVAGGSPNNYAPIDYTNCGNNSWTLSVITSPGQTCTITPSSGSFTISSNGNANLANPSPVVINCTVVPQYSVSGTISGLSGSGLVLADNLGDTLPIGSGATSFAFGAEWLSGAAYSVTIRTQPSGQTCSLSANASGTIGSASVSTVVVSCTTNGTGGGGSGGAKVYAVDSTNTLFEFDAQGNFIASVGLPGGAGSIGNLNGGGITVDATNVYVTMGAPSTGVAAFNRSTLAPVTLASGSFGSLSAPRAITYDPLNSQFYVANGGSTVTVYGATGAFLSTFSQSSGALYGPSGITYDPTDNAIWVANYTGGTASASPSYGISEFTPSGTLIQNFPTGNSNPPTPFAPPVNSGHELPYAISYCLATGSTPANALTVGYITDGGHQGIGEAGGYDITGTLNGSSYPSPTNLHALACSPGGTVFAATDNGLKEYGVFGGSLGPAAGAFPGMTAPVYGVAFSSGGLSSPQGLLVAGGQLYIANSGTNQVLIYRVQTDTTSGLVTGMTQTGAIASDLNGPVRLAMDSSGHLFVANIGNNTVTAYDTTNANQEVTGPGGTPLISGGHINRPLGIAVDSARNVYVANNGSNSISVYNPNSALLTAGFTEAAFSPLTADSASVAFSAPGVLYDASFLGSDYLVVGLGPTTGANQILVYPTPITGAPTSLFTISSANCSSMPTGPTGIVAFFGTTQSPNPLVFMSSYYNAPAGSVVEYSAAQLFGAPSSCPAPSATTGSSSLVSRPEGVAVDAAGLNVFVSNSGNNTVTVYSTASGLSGAPLFTLHN